MSGAVTHPVFRPFRPGAARTLAGPPHDHFLPPPPSPLAVDHAPAAPVSSPPRGPRSHSGPLSSPRLAGRRQDDLRLRVAHDLLRSVPRQPGRSSVRADRSQSAAKWASPTPPVTAIAQPRAQPPQLRGSRAARPEHCIALTSQAGGPPAPRTHARRRGGARCVISDEPHHMGEHAAWGLKTREPSRRHFPPALSRHAVSLRQRGHPVGSRTTTTASCRADYVYGSEALVDGVWPGRSPSCPTTARWSWVLPTQCFAAPRSSQSCPHPSPRAACATALDAHGD